MGVTTYQFVHKIQILETFESEKTNIKKTNTKPEKHLFTNLRKHRVRKRLFSKHNIRACFPLDGPVDDVLLIGRVVRRLPDGHWKNYRLLKAVGQSVLVTRAYKRGKSDHGLHWSANKGSDKT